MTTTTLPSLPPSPAEANGVRGAELRSIDGFGVLDTIREYGLMVRPSLTGQWRAGVWLGTTIHAMPRAYCEDGTEWEAETLEAAVEKCVAAIKARELNPDFAKMQAALSSPNDEGDGRRDETPPRQ